MATNNLNKEAIQKMLSNIPKDKLDGAMKKAEILAKNPNIRNSFSKISESDIRAMLSALNSGDKQKIASMMNNQNPQIQDLIKTFNK